MKRMEKKEGHRTWLFRVVGLLLIAAMLCGGFPQRQAMGAQSKPEDFKIVDGVLVEYCGNGGEVVIPKGVTSIGEYVFDEGAPEAVETDEDYYYFDRYGDRKRITKVIIPEGLSLFSKNPHKT